MSLVHIIPRVLSGLGTFENTSAILMWPGCSLHHLAVGQLSRGGWQWVG